MNDKLLLMQVSNTTSPNKRLTLVLIVRYATMANSEKVTVDRSYFEALLRRQVTIRQPIGPSANPSFVEQILCVTAIEGCATLLKQPD